MAKHPWDLMKMRGPITLVRIQKVICHLSHSDTSSVHTTPAFDLFWYFLHSCTPKRDLRPFRNSVFDIFLIEYPYVVSVAMLLFSVAV